MGQDRRIEQPQHQSFDSEMFQASTRFISEVFDYMRESHTPAADRRIQSLQPGAATTSKADAQGVVSQTSNRIESAKGTDRNESSNQQGLTKELPKLLLEGGALITATDKNPVDADFYKAISGAYKNNGKEGVDQLLQKLSNNDLHLSVAGSQYVKQENNPNFDDILFDIKMAKDGKAPVDLSVRTDAYWKDALVDRPLPAGLPEAAKATFKNDIPNFDTVDTTLFRGAAPNLQGLMDLKALGVKTIIDFRDPKDKKYGLLPDQERAFCEKNGMTYINIPMISNNGPTTQDLAKYFSAINSATKNGGKIFQHCDQGRDRTGVMTGFVDLLENGKNSTKTIADMQAHGISDNEKAAYPFYPRLDSMITAAAGTPNQKLTLDQESAVIKNLSQDPNLNPDQKLTPEQISSLTSDQLLILANLDNWLRSPQGQLPK